MGTGHCLTPHTLIPGPSGVGEFGHLWDGSAGGQSFDQFVADQMGENHPFSSLVWGVFDVAMAIPSRISWRAPFEPVQPMRRRPLPSTACSAPGCPMRHRWRKPARSAFVVDAVLSDYRRLQARVGMEDRARLDAHMSSLYDLERTVERLDLGSCNLPDRTDVSGPARWARPTWACRGGGRL